jgi:hypothetical protein
LPGTAAERPGLLGPLPASAVGILEGEEAQKAQFAQRMRRAEDAHNAEVALKSESSPKKIVISNKNAGKTQKVEESHDLGGSYWRWLRWGSGSPQKEELQDASPSPVPSPPSPQSASTSSSAEKPKPSGSWLRWVSGMSSTGDKKP